MKLFNIFKPKPKEKQGQIINIRNFKHLVEMIIKDKYSENKPFNIMYLRDNCNDFQIMHRGVMKNNNLSTDTAFGFVVLMSFENNEIQLIDKFKKSTLYDHFQVLKENDLKIVYYCDCGMDVEKLENLSYEIMEEIYNYDTQTVFEIKFIEY